MPSMSLKISSYCFRFTKPNSIETDILFLRFYTALFKHKEHEKGKLNSVNALSHEQQLKMAGIIDGK